MSGTKLVPFLSANKDVYITGGPVSKLEPFPQELATHNVELVLCAAAMYKLSTPLPPPEPLETEVSALGPAQSTSTFLFDGKSSTKRKAASSGVPTPQPTLKWRTPLYTVLRTYSLTEWYKSITKAPPEELAKISSGKGATTKVSKFPDHGFVVEFISEKPNTKNVDKYHPLVRYHISALVDSKGPYRLNHLRYRFFSAPTAVESQEWLAVCQAASCNYWHERVEKSLIPDPDVFQFHTWAVLQPGQLVHCILSTGALIVTPAFTPAAMKEGGTPTSRTTAKIEQLQRCSLTRREPSVPKGTVKLVFKPAVPLLESGLLFTTGALAMEFVSELHRVWGLVKREEPFPME